MDVNRRVIHVRPQAVPRRLGLGLRAVFVFGENAATFDRVGTHDEIKRYLKSF
jgi:hypothetical protein